MGHLPERTRTWHCNLWLNFTTRSISDYITANGMVVRDFWTNWCPDRGVILLFVWNKIKLKWSRYRPGVAQRLVRGIAVLFHDRGIRRGWVVSSTPRLRFTPGKDPVPIVQEAGWESGPVWRGGKSRPHRDSIPDRSVAIPTELPGSLFVWNI
jgi:hypothetical protein